MNKNFFSRAGKSTNFRFKVVSERNFRNKNNLMAQQKMSVLEAFEQLDKSKASKNSEPKEGSAVFKSVPRPINRDSSMPCVGQYNISYSITQKHVKIPKIIPQRETKRSSNELPKQMISETQIKHSDRTHNIKKNIKSYEKENKFSFEISPLVSKKLKIGKKKESVNPFTTKNLLLPKLGSLTNRLSVPVKQRRRASRL